MNTGLHALFVIIGFLWNTGLCLLANYWKCNMSTGDAVIELVTLKNLGAFVPEQKSSNFDDRCKSQHY